MFDQSLWGCTWPRYKVFWVNEDFPSSLHISIPSKIFSRSSLISIQVKPSEILACWSISVPLLIIHICIMYIPVPSQIIFSLIDSYSYSHYYGSLFHPTSIRDTFKFLSRFDKLNLIVLMGYSFHFHKTQRVPMIPSEIKPWCPLDQTTITIWKEHVSNKCCLFQ